MVCLWKYCLNDKLKYMYFPLVKWQRSMKRKVRLRRIICIMMTSSRIPLIKTANALRLAAILAHFAWALKNASHFKFRICLICRPSRLRQRQHLLPLKWLRDCKLNPRGSANARVYFPIMHARLPPVVVNNIFLPSTACFHQSELYMCIIDRINYLILSSCISSQVKLTQQGMNNMK